VNTVLVYMQLYRYIQSGFLLKRKQNR